MFFQPLGDGYSLLCSQKSSFRGTQSLFVWTECIKNIFEFVLLMLFCGLFIASVSQVLCRGCCFLSYTAKSSHHPMAALTPKERLCQEENITSRI
jgi:hypothetical protein